MGKRKWTKRDANILYKEIKKHPYSLKKAFKEAAEKIGKTPSACQVYWYRKTKNPNNTSCFLLIGRESYTKNRKNPRSEKLIKEKKGILNRILKWIKS